MRISIKKHNQVYLQSLADELQIDDLGEVLNYVLVNIRGLGWSYKDNKPVPLPQQTQLGYNFDPSTFERIAPIPEQNQNYSEDPIIARFASLIEEF
ncbi:MAG: hypothetical protein ACR2LR_06035 [Hassallia sp.]